MGVAGEAPHGHIFGVGIDLQRIGRVVADVLEHATGMSVIADVGRHCHVLEEVADTADGVKPQMGIAPLEVVGGVPDAVVAEFSVQVPGFGGHDVAAPAGVFHRVPGGEGPVNGAGLGAEQPLPHLPMSQAKKGGSLSP